MTLKNNFINKFNNNGSFCNKLKEKYCFGNNYLINCFKGKFMFGVLLTMFFSIFIILILNSSIIYAQEISGTVKTTSSTSSTSGIGSATFSGPVGGEFSGGFGGSYVFSNPQYYPVGFQGDGAYYSYYGVWPDNYQDYQEMCKQRQDFIIQIPAGGCSPVIVRSDLIAEQNVAVFCKLQAIQINPLIDVNYLKSITFTHRGNSSNMVGGVGYYRPKVALSSRINVHGFPTMDNVGYAVIILKRNANEKTLPEFVSGNLTARLIYDSPNAFGSGQSEIIVPELSEEKWETNYQRYSFFDGKGYLRVDSVGSDYVDVSVYIDKETQIGSFRVRKGQSSGEYYLPGFYCQASYKVTLNGFENADVSARIVVDGEEYDVYKGEKFANGLCILQNIESKGAGSGKATISCNGKSFSLELGLFKSNFEVNGESKNVNQGDFIHIYPDGKKLYFASLTKDNNGKEIAVLYINESFNDELKTAVSQYVNSNVNNPDLINWANYYILSYGEEKEIEEVKIKFIKSNQGEDVNSGNSDFENSFKTAIDSYYIVDSDYKEVKYGSDPNVLGKKALINAAELAKGKDKDKTLAEINQKLKESYEYDEIDSYLNFDNSKSSQIVSSGTMTNVVVLKSINVPDFDEKGVKLIVDRNEMLIRNNGEFISEKDTKGGFIQVKSFSDEAVFIEAKCIRGDNVETINGDAGKISLGSNKVICDKNIFVSLINLKKNARLSIGSVSKNVGSEINISYNIGIEKRAIELTPAKTSERIKRLNESISEWNNISDSLGKAVKGMKAACFATSAVLQIKNLFGNMGGKAIARQEVMRGSGGWNQLCSAAMANSGLPDLDVVGSESMSGGPYNSLDDCYRQNNDKIESDVNLYSQNIEKINNEIKSFEENGNFVKDGGILSGKSVDYSGAREAYLKKIQGDSSLSNVISDNGKEGKEKEEIVVGEILNGLESESATYEELRQIKFYSSILNDKSASSSAQNVAKTKLYDVLNSIRKVKEYDNGQTLAQENGKLNNVIGDLGFSGPDYEENTGPYYYTGAKANIKGESVGIHLVGDKESPKDKYYVGLKKIDGEKYEIESVYGYGQDGVIGQKLTDENLLNKLKKQYPYFILRDAGSYNNEYRDPEVRYYETDPYKGMPAIVPIDLKQGWYAATKQTLPTFGNIEAYQESGRVNSFWLCNVGQNSREEFISGLGDDECQQFNVYTGQALDVFPGLSESKVKELVGKSVKALESVASQYKSGIQRVNVPGVGSVKVGNPAVNLPGTQCQDFMSPKDCQLMFNVCDPVICPSSRCNLGGKYYVSDVVQTGIVGGVLMCLPNYKDGILVPVCLSGIKAGIDNYLSILTASRDCLQENLNSGEYVGICDEITAIYTCEFFWNQIAPATNVLLPKLLEKFAGNNAKGGGEYLSVQSSWDNMQNSISYFKDYYGVNAFKAFNARSTQEVGTPVCKAFVSTKYPNKFKTLIEPDSPTQFSAWFTEIKQTTATVPAISQYKVYYHIYAGEDIGASYTVYLKDVQGESFFNAPGNAHVATGYIGKGEYVDEARDFTAPSGYKQLCVRINAQDECGFNQVSTSFALNYIRDSYINNQLTQTSITTQKECVGGSADALALVNPNLQAGVEDTINPQIYNSGVIRICSTSNPGTGTEPERWQKMGYCDDQKIGCWLDRESVANSITSENYGIRNKTISELDQIRDQIASEDGQIFIDTQVLVVRLIEIEKMINELYYRANVYGYPTDSDIEDEENFDSDVEEVRDLLDEYKTKYILTSEQNGIIAYLGANLNAAVAQRDWSIVLQERSKKQEVSASEGGGETPDEGEGGESGGEEFTGVAKEINEVMIKLKDVSIPNRNRENEIKIREITSLNVNREIEQWEITALSGLTKETLWVALGLKIGSKDYGNNFMITGAGENAGVHSTGDHPKGYALDIAYNGVSNSIYNDYKNYDDSQWENRYGFPKNAIANFLDEKNKPSESSTGDHFHIKVDQNKMKEFISKGSSTSSTTSSSGTSAGTTSLNYEIKYTPIAQQVANEVGIDVNLLKAVIKVESGWNPTLKSEKGAKGIMQIMEVAYNDVATDKGYCYNKICSGKDFSGWENIVNPSQSDVNANMMVGACYLKCIGDIYGFYGNEAILAAYNAGPSNTLKTCATQSINIPPCSFTNQEYVDQVLAQYKIYSAS